MLVTGVAAPSFFSTARYWSSEELRGLAPEESMRLPVRMVPAESCPLALESRSTPSMMSTLLFQLLPYVAASSNGCTDDPEKVRLKFVDSTAPSESGVDASAVCRPQSSAAIPCGW